MNKEEVYELINKNPVFFLATAAKDKPQVRGMMLFSADAENGILFHTGAMKPVYKQVQENPAAELCFIDYAKNTQVRVSGQLEIVEDTALKDTIYEHPSRSFLKGWRESGSLDDFYHSFIVMRLKGGTAKVWTMETNFAPGEEIQL